MPAVRRPRPETGRRCSGDVRHPRAGVAWYSLTGQRCFGAAASCWASCWAWCWSPADAATCSTETSDYGRFRRYRPARVPPPTVGWRVRVGHPRGRNKRADKRAYKQRVTREGKRGKETAARNYRVTETGTDREADRQTHVFGFVFLFGSSQKL